MDTGGDPSKSGLPQIAEDHDEDDPFLLNAGSPLVSKWSLADSVSTLTAQLPTRVLSRSRSGAVERTEKDMSVLESSNSSVVAQGKEEALLHYWFSVVSSMPSWLLERLPIYVMKAGAMEMLVHAPSETAREPVVQEDTESAGALPDAVQLASTVAKDAVQAILRRSEYGALKVLAWRFPRGAHIIAISSSSAQHAIVGGSDEVIHKVPPKGRVISESWLAFAVQYPLWRVEAWPTSSSHADEILARARARVGAEEGASLLSSDSEHFAKECYSGESSHAEALTKAALITTCTTTGLATGAVAAYPFAFSTVPVYVFGGLIPWGTATVFSGGVVALGAAAGAAVGAAVLAPAILYTSYSKGLVQQELPFFIVNETSLSLQICAISGGWSVADWSSKAQGELRAEHILELSPPGCVEEFELEARQIEPTSSWSGYISRERKGHRVLNMAKRGCVYLLTQSTPKESTTSALDYLVLTEIPRCILPAYSPCPCT